MDEFISEPRQLPPPEPDYFVSAGAIRIGNAEAGLYLTGKACEHFAKIVSYALRKIDAKQAGREIVELEGFLRTMDKATREVRKANADRVEAARATAYKRPGND